MRTFIKPLAVFFCSVLAVGLLGVSCKRYEVASENSPFAVSCSVFDGSVNEGVNFTLSVVEGHTGGDCLLRTSIQEAESGHVVGGYLVKSGGGSVIGDGDKWSFDKDGMASFVLTGLPKGSYVIHVSVIRWYHSATAEASFKVIQ